MRHFPLERCGTRGAICDPQGHRTIEHIICRVTYAKMEVDFGRLIGKQEVMVVSPLADCL